MKKLWVLRLFFVLSVVGLLFFFWYSFRQYQMSASDPLTQVDPRTEWMLVIHDWTQVDQWMKQDSLSDIGRKVRADMEQWKTWYSEYPEVQRWLKEQPTYLFYGSAISQSVIWSWGLPDKWNDEDLVHLQSYIPHLQLKNDILYWSMDEMALNQWEGEVESENPFWIQGRNLMDKSLPVSWMVKQDQGWICLDFDRYQWVGLMSVDSTKDWKGMWPADTTQGNWAGAQASYGWSSQVPEWKLDSTIRARYKVFSMDTLCDCDTWESWTTWQSDLWTWMKYDSGWVATQKPVVRPWKWLAPLLRDTTQRIKRFKDPTLLPPLTLSSGPSGWRLAADWSGGILLATDSASLLAYTQDTAAFSTLRFPVAASRRVYREIWAQGKMDNAFSPIRQKHWVMGKAKGEMNIFLSDNPNQWIVQLRAIK